MGQRGRAVTGCFERWRTKSHEAEIGLLGVHRREAAKRRRAANEQVVRIVRQLARKHRDLGLAVEDLLERPGMLARRRHAEDAMKRLAVAPHLGLARRP